MSDEPKIINDRGLDILFREARSYNGWLDQGVSDVLVEAVFDLMKWGPTSANCSPARFLFVKSNEQKEKLKPHILDGNIDKIMTAPVIAIIANDLEFYNQLPKLFPHTNAKSWFEGKESLIEETAMRNGSLQGAYLMIAARGLGLDCGPISGFRAKGVKEAFFPDDNYEVNFLCCLGQGDPESIFERSPRFQFDDICKII